MADDYMKVGQIHIQRGYFFIVYYFFYINQLTINIKKGIKLIILSKMIIVYIIYIKIN